MVTLARTRAAVNHLFTTPLALYYIVYPILERRGLDLTSFAWPDAATVAYQLLVCLVAEVGVWCCLALCCILLLYGIVFYAFLCRRLVGEICLHISTS